MHMERVLSLFPYLLRSFEAAHIFYHTLFEY